MPKQAQKTKYSDPMITINGLSVHSREKDSRIDYVLSKKGHYLSKYDSEQKRPVILSFKTRKDAESYAVHSVPS